MTPEDFYIVSRASAGVRVDLTDPEGNREWMRVRSSVSEEFRQASARVIGRVLDAAKGDTPSNPKIQNRQRRAELASALIADWSLPMRSDEEKIALLIQNPRLRRQIERIADDHSLHFGVSQ